MNDSVFTDHNPITGRIESHTGDQCNWLCSKHSAERTANDAMDFAENFIGTGASATESNAQARPMSNRATLGRFAFAFAPAAIGIALTALGGGGLPLSFGIVFSIVAWKLAWVLSNRALTIVSVVLGIIVLLPLGSFLLMLVKHLLF